MFLPVSFGSILYRYLQIITTPLTVLLPETSLTPLRQPRCSTFSVFRSLPFWFSQCSAKLRLDQKLKIQHEYNSSDDTWHNSWNHNIISVARYLLYLSYVQVTVPVARYRHNTVRYNTSWSMLFYLLFFRTIHKEVLFLFCTVFSHWWWRMKTSTYSSLMIVSWNGL